MVLCILTGLPPAQQLMHYNPERSSIHGSPTASNSSRTSERRPASPTDSSPGSSRRHMPGRSVI